MFTLPRDTRTGMNVAPSEGDRRSPGAIASLVFFFFFFLRDLAQRSLGNFTATTCASARDEETRDVVVGAILNSQDQRAAYVTSRYENFAVPSSSQSRTDSPVCDESADERWHIAKLNDSSGAGRRRCTSYETMAGIRAWKVSR